MITSIRHALLQPILAFIAIHGGARLADADILIAVDENGGSSFVNTASGLHTTLPFALLADPGPGGLASVLTYNLLGPPSLVAGDVLLQDGVGGPIFDVVRFNPAGTGGNPNYPASLLFYSDNTDGVDSLGDTPGPPRALYPNFLIILEAGPEGNNGAVYTPTAGQPGFVAGNTVQYQFVSDGSVVVPEPSSWVLLATVLVPLVVVVRRRAPRYTGSMCN